MAKKNETQGRKWTEAERKAAIKRVAGNIEEPGKGEWASIPALTAKFWKPTKEGEILQGIVVAAITEDGKFKEQRKYTINTDDGGAATFYASGQIRDRLEVAEAVFGIPFDVRLTFKGMVKIKGFANKGREYDLAARPSKG